MECSAILTCNSKGRVAFLVAKRPVLKYVIYLTVVY